MNENDILLTVKDLRTHFFLAGGNVLKAVDGISFSVHRSQTLGIVGESGLEKV